MYTNEPERFPEATKGPSTRTVPLYPVRYLYLLAGCEGGFVEAPPCHTYERNFVRVKASANPSETSARPTSFDEATSIHARFWGGATWDKRGEKASYHNIPTLCPII